MATTIYYVNRASAGGDGSSNGESGASAAFASIVDAEALNLSIGAGDTVIIECCGTTADTPVNFAGWTINATATLIVRANRSHPAGFYDGPLEWSPNHYRIETTSAFNAVEFACRIIWDGIQVLNDRASGASGFVPGANSAGSIIRNCRVRKTTGTAVGGITLTSSSTINNILLENNIIVGWTVGVSAAFNAALTGANFLRLYHNLIARCGTAVSLSGTGTPAVALKNNTRFDNTDDYANTSSGTITIDHDGSDDGDGTNAIDVGNGSEPAIWADHWVDPNNATTASRDYTPKATGVLPGAGLGSGSDANLPLADLLGVTRSTTAPTLGPLEYVPPAGNPLLIRMMMEMA